MSDTMKDFRKLPAYEVWTNGSDFIVLGDPPMQDDDSEEGHNCDQMGCGACHVIARGRIDILGLQFEKLEARDEQ